MRVHPSFLVDAHDAAVLRGWVDDAARPKWGRRALIVPLCADGHGPSAVAAWMQCSKQTVIAWQSLHRQGPGRAA
jgi:hypothetical protein